jgi:hypothetical protein
MPNSVNQALADAVSLSLFRLTREADCAKDYRSRPGGRLIESASVSRYN